MAFGGRVCGTALFDRFGQKKQKELGAGELSSRADADLRLPADQADPAPKFVPQFT